MSPAAFLEAASAWALAPGFRRGRNGQWPSAAADDTTAGDTDPQHRSSDLGADRGEPRSAAAATNAHSDHGPGGRLPSRRHVTDESEAA